MRFLVRTRWLLAAPLAVAVLAADAASLPEAMTLPATYSVRGLLTTVMVARYRGQVRTYVRRSRARDTFTLDEDGTFAAAGLVGDGLPATGTWTETEPNVIGRTYDADVEPRLETMIESQINLIPGFRNADVTCTMIPRAVKVRREGARLKGADRIDFKVTGGAARMAGRLVIRWRGSRAE